MTAPVPAGSTDAQAQLREEIARELNRHRWISRCRPETGVRCQCGCWRGSRGMAVQRHFADAVLALPAVRDALAAQEEAEQRGYERGRRDFQFQPSGDNHHNAALCPYCSPRGDR